MLPRLLVFACLASSVLPGCGGMSIRPAGASGVMDDSTITARVKTTLLNDTQVSARTIDVSTSNGVGNPVFANDFAIDDPSFTYGRLTGTPEPGSIALLGTGLLGMASAIRRKLKK